MLLSARAASAEAPGPHPAARSIARRPRVLLLADAAPVSVPGDVPVCDGDPRCAMDQRTDQVVSLVILQE